jgi:hypothetical protein
MKLQTITFTQQEIWSAMKRQVVKSKKTYTRKNKHKGKE